jgi:predicted protein tyrosine phosphatase
MVRNALTIHCRSAIGRSTLKTLGQPPLTTLTTPKNLTVRFLGVAFKPQQEIAS